MSIYIDVLLLTFVLIYVIDSIIILLLYYILYTIDNICFLISDPTYMFPLSEIDKIVEQKKINIERKVKWTHRIKVSDC